MSYPTFCICINCDIQCYILGLNGAKCEPTGQKKKIINLHNKFHSRKSSYKGAHNTRDFSTRLIKVFKYGT